MCFKTVINTVSIKCMKTIEGICCILNDPDIAACDSSQRNMLGFLPVCSSADIVNKCLLSHIMIEEK